MTDNYIKKEIIKLKRRFDTSNPFDIADGLSISVLSRPLQSLKGFYCICMRNRYIVINSELPSYQRRIICAHELGHDRLHRHFAKYTSLRDHTYFDMTSKPEREANIFACELLISDADVLNNRNMPAESLGCMLGVDELYVKLKLELMAKEVN